MENRTSSSERLWLEMDFEKNCHHSCTVGSVPLIYLGVHLNSCIYIYIYLYVYIEKTWIRVMSFIMSELSTFCVVCASCFYFYHQQLHQTSHKAICFSDIRLENVLKNSHRGSRVRRQDKARWSKMVASTSLNGIS